MSAVIFFKMYNYALRTRFLLRSFVRSNQNPVAFECSRAIFHWRHLLHIYLYICNLFPLICTVNSRTGCLCLIYGTCMYYYLFSFDFVLFLALENSEFAGRTDFDDFVIRMCRIDVNV